MIIVAWVAEQVCCDLQEQLVRVQDDLSQLSAFMGNEGAKIERLLQLLEENGVDPQQTTSVLDEVCSPPHHQEAPSCKKDADLNCCL